MSSPPRFTLFTGATVMTMDPTVGILSPGQILVEGEVIKEVGSSVQVPEDGEVSIIDAQDCIIIPGFIDAHHHMWQQLLRGVTTDWSLLDYMVGFRSVYGSVFTAEDVELANYAASLSLLNNGVTTVLDHCHVINSSAHADAALNGIKKSGIRATLCYGLFVNTHVPEELKGFDAEKREADTRRFRKEHFDKNDPATELVTFGLAPFEAEMVPVQETIRQIALGRELGARIITMHVAIGPYDVNHAEIVRQLSEADALGPDIVLSHGASLTPAEFHAIRDSGASVVATPDTDLQMGMGFPVAFHAKEMGCRACLGLDITSNQGNDFIAQMRLALQVERARRNEAELPFDITPKTEDVLRMGTLGGAEAMRLENLVGSITAGKKADLVMFRADDIETIPNPDPASTIVFHSSLKHIDTVMVNGRVVKRNGELVGVDWPALRQAITRHVAGIKERAAVLADVQKEEQTAWRNMFKPPGKI